LGLQAEKDSILHLQGLITRDIKTEYQSEAIYTAEVDHDFPRLTIGETPYFAARTR
jgi:hypothetical protein